jgi:hypothetical protein
MQFFRGGGMPGDFQTSGLQENCEITVFFVTSILFKRYPLK